MHDIASIAGKLAGIISLAAFVPYILSILRKQTKAQSGKLVHLGDR